MKSQSAVTLLLSILVLGAIGLSITISMTLAGINRSQTSHEYEKKIRAQSLAIACTEEAFEQIRADNNFTGTGSLNLGSETCNYEVIDTGGENRTIEAVAALNSGLTKRARTYITALSPDIVVASVRDVGTFTEQGGGGCTNCRMFVTSGSWTGNLGGISGADAKCQADSNHPGGGATFKAMLADAGEREIGQDWVFGANQTYYRLDGTTVIDTTDANGVFTFEMDNTVMASIVNANTWTGMEIDMTESTHTCDSWTVGQVTSSGSEGDPDSTLSLFAQSLDEYTCDNARHIVCVEQTALDNAPTLSSTNPSDDATDISTSANLVMTFSENVQAGSGNILIKKTSDDTTFETVPVGSTTISGTTVTINPSSDFANSTGYYVTLASGVVEDTASNAYAGISDKTTWNFTTESSGGGGGCTTCKIFVTATSYDGDLGGVSGADTKCDSDSNKPGGGGTYKALIGDTNRVSGGSDWVLKDDTAYYRGDGTTLIDVTGTGSAPDDWFEEGTYMDNAVIDSAYVIWTGLNSDGSLATDHCSSWTSSESAESGEAGSADEVYIENTIAGNGAISCLTSHRLYCVEQ